MCGVFYFQPPCAGPTGKEWNYEQDKNYPRWRNNKWFSGAIHGITLSAWAFAGLSGNQLATWIVNHFGDLVEIEGHMVNPTGYQIVLYVTAALYLVALLLSVVLVRPVSQQKKDN